MTPQGGTLVLEPSPSSINSLYFSSILLSLSLLLLFFYFFLYFIPLLLPSLLHLPPQGFLSLLFLLFSLLEEKSLLLILSYWWTPPQQQRVWFRDFVVIYSMMLSLLNNDGIGQMSLETFKIIWSLRNIRSSVCHSGYRSGAPAAGYPSKQKNCLEMWLFFRAV